MDLPAKREGGKLGGTETTSVTRTLTFHWVLCRLRARVVDDWYTTHDKSAREGRGAAATLRGARDVTVKVASALSPHGAGHPRK